VRRGYGGASSSEGVALTVRLTVGILAYNSERRLPDLLASLPAGLAGVDDWHLVIADGASADGTLEVARRLAPDAAIVGLGANRGFAAAANAVISFDQSTDAVLILSPTVRLSPGCVRPMLAALGRPAAGIAVPRLFRGTGKPFPSLRRRPTLLRAWSEALLGGGLARRIGALSELIADPADYTSQTRADWATGAVTMMSRECLKQAGDWDETFFLYSEETEFELRAADAGFRLTFADVNVTHLGGEARIRPELYALQCANKVRLYGMRHRRLPSGLFFAAVLLGEALRALSRRTPIHRAAAGKLARERRALISGQPAQIPPDRAASA
jgi:N-acetylglucosaminyl-diphospho-decaprenol L-rhamnosyltransferase